MKTIICGGRHYEMDFIDHAMLSSLANSWGITEVVSGGANGADAGGEAWARSRQLPIKRFKPDWSVGRHAGFLRNQEMADYADACIVFPGGNGTADMEHRARKKGLIVLRVEAVRYYHKPFNPLDHEQTK